MILDKHPDLGNIGLKAIGYWCSNINIICRTIDCFAGSSLPNPANFVGKWENEKVKEKVINYVKFAPAYECWMGWSSCRFCSSDLGSKCLSDGTYIWPEGFFHYLEVHNVIPPQEFLNHVLGKQ